MHMTTERVMLEEPIPAIAELARCLDTCQFKEFWVGVEKLGEVIAPIAGFFDSVRGGITETLTITHSKVPMEVLKTCLNLDEAGVKAFIAKVKNPAWTPEADGLAVKQAESAVSVKEAASKESDIIPFSKLTPLFTPSPAPLSSQRMNIPS